MRTLPFLLLIVFSLSLATTASAQRAKLAKEYYTDSHNGFEVRLLDDWSIVPVQASEEFGTSTIIQADGPMISVRAGNQAFSGSASLRIYKFDTDDVSIKVTGKKEGEEEAEIEIVPRNIADHLKMLVRESRTLKSVKKEQKKFRSATATHEVFSYFTGSYKLVFDTWTFDLGDYDIVIAYDIPEQHYKKWGKAFADSAKSLRLIERTERVELGDKRNYDQFLAYHKEDVSRTPGWNLLETPTKRYLIKTSSEDSKFIDKIIDRLEKSRDLFERDFPPSKPIDAISVVRICATMDEFHKYGKTGGGVAGWFNPGTEELVLVDFKNYDRNITWGVATHEAFHQYCHFLFDQAEAHRWFDEGHGDFYGAFEFKGKKAIPKVRMKGFQRVDRAREQARDDTFVPISEHVRQDHGTWQSRGVNSYAQSWSIIYFLRQGMLGDVPRRLWSEEYSRIIPDYMAALHKGYQDAYEEVRKERLEKAQEKGDTTGVVDNEITRFSIKHETKEKIWEDAIQASWGKIEESDPELEEFTEKWLEFVVKHLRD